VNTAIKRDANAIAITSIREDITNILSTCMTCFKKKRAAKSRFWRWRWRNFAFRNSRITSVWNHQIYAPDGRAMGLQGMINDLVQQSDFPRNNSNELDQLELNQRLSPESYQQLKIFRMLRQTLDYPKSTQFNGNLNWWLRIISCR
jgi:hypothetical protein